MKVIILKGVTGQPFNLGAFVGDIIEVSNEQGEKLISAGRAELVAQSKEIETPESKMPKKQTRTKGLPTGREGAE